MRVDENIVACSLQSKNCGVTTADRYKTTTEEWWFLPVAAHAMMQYII
jgi:hypothetical protein